MKRRGFVGALFAVLVGGGSRAKAEPLSATRLELEEWEHDTYHLPLPYAVIAPAREPGGWTFRVTAKGLTGSGLARVRENGTALEWGRAWCEAAEWCRSNGYIPVRG